MYHDLVEAPWTSIKPTHLPIATTGNLGDQVQTYAARQLWKSAAFVDRDRPRTWPKDAVVPLCGWFGHHRQPFPAFSDVVIIGFHCSTASMNCLANHRRWLKESVQRQGFPAFCRDIHTRDFVRSLGVDAEFGGCVTLTLEPYGGPREGELIIDYPKYRGPMGSTNWMPALRQMTCEDRMLTAQRQVDRLAKAATVTTSRLHAWLPALALGTPAKLKLEVVNYELIRFSGYNTKAERREELFRPYG